MTSWVTGPASGGYGVASGNVYSGGTGATAGNAQRTSSGWVSSTGAAGLAVTPDLQSGSCNRRRFTKYALNPTSQRTPRLDQAIYEKETCFLVGVAGREVWVAAGSQPRSRAQSLEEPEQLNFSRSTLMVINSFSLHFGLCQGSAWYVIVVLSSRVTQAS